MSNSLRMFRHALLASGKPGTGRTLWFGFGVLILLLLALGTVFTFRLGTISTHLRVQTEIIRPRVAAAREMEILLLSFVGNARGFLNGNAESRQLAEADAGQMAAYLAEYLRLAETGEQRQMAAEFSAQWSELRDHAATLLSRAQSSTEDLRKMSAMRVKLRHLIDKRIQPDSLAFQEARTTATLSSLAHSLRLSFLLLCGATLLALFTSIASARTVLNSQEALRKSEAFLGEVLNSSFAGVYVYDLQRAAHVFINRQYTVLTGHTLDGFSSMDRQEFLALFHPEDAPRVAEHIEQVARATDGEVLEVEYRFRTADGRWMWALSRNSVFTRKADGSARQLIGSALDITSRKQAEEALRASEERLRLAQQVARIGTFDWDVLHGVNTWTPEADALYGLEPGTFSGTQDAWAKLIYPEDRPSLLALAEQTYQTGELAEAEFRVQWPDGSIHWLISRWQAIKDASGRLVRVTGVNFDITARKQAEMALRESESMLRSFFDASGMMRGIVEVVAENDVRHVVANAVTAGYLGLTPEAMRNQLGSELGEPEEIRRLWIDRYDESRRTGRPVRFEYIDRRGEKRAWLSAVVTYLGTNPAGKERFAYAVLDISELKETEAELRARETELKRVVDTSAAGLARCSRDLRYIYVNSPFAQMVGFSMEQIAGRTIQEVIGEPAFERIRPYVDRTLHGERVEYEIEVPLATGVRYMHVIYTPDEESDERIAGFFVSLVDLTEQKSLEREVLRISEIERQRVGSELHEGICQELIAAGFTAKGLQRRLEKDSNPLASTMEALTNAISQTAAHTRQLAHGMSPVLNAADGLEHALRALAVGTAERHHVCCQFECSSPVTIPNLVVSTQLYRIAQEAIHNTVKHSGANRIEVELGESGSEACLAVKDNGCGLPPNVDKGSGFGLRSMRYRAGLIYGRLTIQNREGGGTEVICHVPKRLESEKPKDEYI